MLVWIDLNGSIWDSVLTIDLVQTVQQIHFRATGTLLKCYWNASDWRIKVSWLNWFICDFSELNLNLMIAVRGFNRQINLAIWQIVHNLNYFGICQSGNACWSWKLRVGIGNFRAAAMTSLNLKSNTKSSKMQSIWTSDSEATESFSKPASDAL